MDEETARALNALNVGFYRTHAGEFSATRARPWRGWSALLELVPQRPLRVLDVGCGNARFGRFLSGQRTLARYTGVDASEPLLAIARSDPPAARQLDWVVADFTAGSPDDALPRRPHDLVVLFGVLHGVAGEALRQRLLAACAERLAPGGLLAFTCWRFGADARIARRIAARQGAPAPIDPRALDAGDHLLPWGEEAGAWRYGRDIDPAERERLLAGLRLERLRDFTEDGGDDAGRAHNHYSVLRRPLPGTGDRG